MAEFDAAVGAKYQQLVNQGYADTMDLVRQGLVRNNKTVIGSRVDAYARQELRVRSAIHIFVFSPEGVKI